MTKNSVPEKIFTSRKEGTKKGPNSLPQDLLAVIIAGLIACIFMSFPLWLNARTVPLAPVIEGMVFTENLQWTLLGVWFVLMAVSLYKKVNVQYTLPGIVIISIILGLQDQLRWQPWHYQFLLMIFFYWRYSLKKISREALINIYRIILIGIYFWSGAHKVNAAFVEEILGGMILTNVGVFGYSIPLIEMLFALGLVFIRWRKVAVIGLEGMHVMIIGAVVFGSMKANSVIIPWNIAQMILIYTLFWNYRDTEIFNFKEAVISKALAIILFVILPGLNFSGHWDSYPSFSLYSGKTDRADLYVNESFKDQFSEEARKHFDKENKIYIQKWSFTELNVPVYPEKRVYKQVFKSLCKKAVNEFDVVLHTSTMERLLENERKEESFFCDEIE